MKGPDSTVPPLPEKFYAVRSGRVPGIYTDWPSAQKQIIGWQKPKQKCFPTRAEAERFMRDEDIKHDERSEVSAFDYNDNSSSLTWKDGFDTSTTASIPKKSKKSLTINSGYSKNSKMIALEYNEDDYEPGLGPLPPGAEDGFDPHIFLDGKTGNMIYKTQAQRSITRLQATGLSPNGMLRVHTDGSSIGNGTKAAIAGIGVYFGPNDRRFDFWFPELLVCFILTRPFSETYRRRFLDLVKPTNEQS